MTDATNFPDSNPPKGSDGTANSRRVRTFLKIAIVLIVIAGIGRTVQLAWKDILNNESRVASELRTLDKEIESVTETPRNSDRENRIRELSLKRDLIDRSRFLWANVRWEWYPMAIAFGLITILLQGIVWYNAIRALGSPVPFWPTQAAYSLGSLGKYVPGKAMAVLLRATGMKRWNVDYFVSIVAVFVEALMTLSTAGTIGALFFLFEQPPLWLLQFAIVTAVLSFIPMLPPIFQRVLSFVVRVKSMGLWKSHTANANYSDASVESTEVSIFTTRFSWRLMTKNWIIAGLSWIFMGLSLAMCAWTITSYRATSHVLIDNINATNKEVILHNAADNSDLKLTKIILVSIAAASLSFVVGFVSMLPGGAGVRELTITLLLAPVIGYAPALVASILFRLANLISELIMAGFTRRLTRNFKMTS